MVGEEKDERTVLLAILPLGFLLSSLVNSIKHVRHHLGAGSCIRAEVPWPYTYIMTNKRRTFGHWIGRTMQTTLSEDMHDLCNWRKVVIDPKAFFGGEMNYRNQKLEYPAINNQST